MISIEPIYSEGATIPQINNFHNNPIAKAHAHNDYLQKHPLEDALNFGFSSIEVDVYLLKGELYVSHNRPIILNPNRTLTKLYLEPLFYKYKVNNGCFFPNSDQSISLMIDIKNRSHGAYEALLTAIEPYQEMFTYWENNEACDNAVNIILTGKRPINKILTEQKRWVQIDGRLKDLGKNYPASLMPLISGSYHSVCGDGLFKRKCRLEKLKRIRSIAQRISGEGKQFRIWRTPENKKTWNALLDNGVNVINSDSLSLLSKFLTERNQNGITERFSPKESN